MDHKQFLDEVKQKAITARHQIFMRMATHRGAFKDLYAVVHKGQIMRVAKKPGCTPTSHLDYNDFFLLPANYDNYSTFTEDDAYVASFLAPCCRVVPLLEALNGLIGIHNRTINLCEQLV